MASNAGPTWRPLLFHTDAGIPLAGMARGPFGISAGDVKVTGDERLLPVGVTLLCRGLILAEAPNGARAMHLVDGLIKYWPEFQDESQFPSLADRLDELAGFIYLAGCRPLIGGY